MKDSRSLSLLHTAPEESLSKVIREKTNIIYTPIDLEPEHYPHLSCIEADVTALPFPEEHFDVIVSNHVMEHILDDDLFLSEMQRVLKPQGMFFLSFPYDKNREKTFQDDNIQSEADRLKYYGQQDHVRIYGRDVFEKLKRYFQLQIVTTADIPMQFQQNWQDSECCILTKK
ncbi:MAG: class I SAM-dependent methyltransferase [Planctomycetia bacterium]|nr:class I SAM-dependent methyltransferase [Planctomycetia bacterium]